MISQRSSLLIMSAIFALSILLILFTTFLPKSEINTAFSGADSLPEFRQALVIGLAMAIPEFIDCVFETFLSFSVRPLRIILLLAVSIPNIIFLWIYCSPNTLVILINIRIITCATICFMHLSYFGELLFRNRLFIALALLFNISCVISCWISLSSIPDYLCLAVIFAFCFSLASLIFGYFLFFWITKIMKLPSNEISIAQLRCSLYMAAIFAIFLGQFVVVGGFGPLSNSNNLTGYLTSNSYISSSLLLVVWVFKGRIIRLETLQANVRIP